MSRLVVACGGSASTCLGLAGVGDLNTTCNSPHSRNGSYGEAFAREGIGVAEYEARRGMVVEGAHSIDALLALGKRKGVELPIMQAVKDLIDDKVALSDIADYLMTRTLKAE
jgi:glycerol-3-phosphate dehydrogenase (NAD(P)+)